MKRGRGEVEVTMGICILIRVSTQAAWPRREEKRTYGKMEKYMPSKCHWTSATDKNLVRPPLWEAETGGSQAQTKTGQLNSLVKTCLEVKKLKRAEQIAQCEGPTVLKPPPQQLTQTYKTQNRTWSGLTSLWWETKINHTSVCFEFCVYGKEDRKFNCWVLDHRQG